MNQIAFSSPFDVEGIGTVYLLACIGRLPVEQGQPEETKIVPVLINDRAILGMKTGNTVDFDFAPDVWPYGDSPDAYTVGDEFTGMSYNDTIEWSGDYVSAKFYVSEYTWGGTEGMLTVDLKARNNILLRSWASGDDSPDVITIRT